MPVFYKYIPNSLRMDATTLAASAMGSRYRWWFECLKLSAVYRENCRAPNALTNEEQKVYEVFGRIRANSTFALWWKRRGSKAFAELTEFRQVLLVDTPFPLKSDPNTFLLQIPKEMSAKTATKKIKAQLQAYYQEHRVDARQNSTAALTLYKSRVKMSTVERSLEIWSTAHNEMAYNYLYEVGNKLKVSYSHMPNDRDDDETASNKKELMSIAVSRYIRQAELLMANAAEGKFPCLDRNDKAQSRLKARRDSVMSTP